FGRSGTSSLKIALNELGFKCYHMRELIENKEDCKYWLELSNLKEEKLKNKFKFNKIFEKRKYKTIVDSPGTDYWIEIINYYNKIKEKNNKINNNNNNNRFNNIKVILSIRDSPEQWYISFSNTVI